MTQRSQPTFPQAYGPLLSRVLMLCALLGGLSLTGCGGGGGTAVPAPSPVTPAAYAVTDLGILPGFTSSTALAISNSGLVAGASYTDKGLYHASLYRQGTLTDLGTLPGYPSLIAYAVNDARRVAGYMNTPSSTPSVGSHAFLFGGGTLQDLGTLGGAQIWLYGNGINQNGQVTGGSQNAGNLYDAFLLSQGKLIDLGHPNGFLDSEGFAINSQGDIASDGDLAPGQTPRHALLYRSGAWQDLGTLVGSDSSALSLNNADQVTGRASTASGTSHALLFTGGKMVDLGTLGSDTVSSGTGINASGVVVGTSGNSHAFVDKCGQMQGLNRLIPANSGWQLVHAFGINDSGQIVGIGTHSNQEASFLLTPLQ